MAKIYQVYSAADTRTRDEQSGQSRRGTKNHGTNLMSKHSTLALGTHVYRDNNGNNLLGNDTIGKRWFFVHTCHGGNTSGALLAHGTGSDWS